MRPEALREVVEQAVREAVERVSVLERLAASETQRSWSTYSWTFYSWTLSAAPRKPSLGRPYGMATNAIWTDLLDEIRPIAIHAFVVLFLDAMLLVVGGMTRLLELLLPTRTSFYEYIEAGDCVLVPSRQRAAPQKVRCFLERDTARQLLELVASDDQLTRLTIDVTETRLSGDDAVETAFLHRCADETAFTS